MAYIPLAQFKKKESGYIPIAQLRGEKLEPIEPVSIDLGLDLFGTKTTTPAILPQGFLTPQTLLKVMGQGIARQWTATGAKIAQKTKLASNDIVDPKSYFGDSPTARALGVSIFGKTEPFNATSEDVETLETFGADPEAVKKFSGSLTILFSTLDVLGAEPFKGVVGLIRTLKRADNAIDVARAMKSVGFADDVIEVYRDVFVPLKTTKEVKTALDAALSLQSKTTGKGYRPVADLMRETGEVAPRVADETFQPLAQEARKFKTAEEFVEVQMPEIPNKPYSLYLGEDIYFSGKIRGKWTDIVFDRRKNNFEVRDLSYGGGSEKFGSLNEAKSYIKSQLTDFYNQAVRGSKKTRGFITSAKEILPIEKIPIEDSIMDVITQFDSSYAGQRIFTEKGVIGAPSNFPKWVTAPELRSRALFDSLMSKLQKGETKFTKREVRLWELVQERIAKQSDVAFDEVTPNLFRIEEEVISKPKGEPFQISRLEKALPQPPTSPPLLKSFSSSDSITDVTKMSTMRKFITSGRTILQKSGSSGRKMASTMDTQRVEQDLLTGRYTVRINKALAGLSKEERFNVTDVLEGGRPLNSKVENAASQLKAWLDEVATKAEADKFEMRIPGGGTVPFKRRVDYFPRQYDFDALAKGRQREAAITHLVETGQAPNPAKAERLLDEMIENAQRRAGNLENPRLLDLPGYERDPVKVLQRYARTVAQRFTEAEYFGKKDEIIDSLIKGIAEDRGDFKEAQRIFDFTVRGVPKNKVVSAITQFNVATKLSLSAIVNATQSINTATKAGILNTVKAVWKGFTPEGKELADLVNAYDDFIYIREGGVDPHKIVKGVMYIFQKVENFNRRTAAIAGKLKTAELINLLSKDPQSSYAIRQLNSLGIDLERALAGTLTENDLLKAANKMIEKTQFKVDPLDIPPSWKTPLGRLITQFKSFSFMQTKFARDEIFKEASHGNLVPFVTFVTLAVPASYVVAMVRNKLTGREQGNIDIREWDKWMKAFGTIPTDALIQAKFLADTIKSEFKTPIEKGARFAGSILGPSADEFGKLIGGLEQIPRIQEKNKYLRRTGKEQAPLLALERQVVEKVPFAGQYLKNKLFGYPKSTKTPEEKASDKVLYDFIDEQVKVPFGDSQAKEKLVEYAKKLSSDDERVRQLFIMRENGVDTKGVSSSGEILRIKPEFDRVQKLLKEGKNQEANATVNKMSDADYEAYKKARASFRASNTQQLRELLTTEPKKAIEFVRSQHEQESKRLLEVMTDEEYKIYKQGK